MRSLPNPQGQGFKRLSYLLDALLRLRGLNYLTDRFIGVAREVFYIDRWNVDLSECTLINRAWFNWKVDRIWYSLFLSRNLSLWCLLESRRLGYLLSHLLLCLLFYCLLFRWSKAKCHRISGCLWGRWRMVILPWWISNRAPIFLRCFWRMVTLPDQLGQRTNRRHCLPEVVLPRAHQWIIRRRRRHDKGSWWWLLVLSPRLLEWIDACELLACSFNVLYDLRLHLVNNLFIGIDFAFSLGWHLIEPVSVGFDNICTLSLHLIKMGDHLLKGF